MKSFKIDDIVICNTSFEGYPQKGWKGKVIYERDFLNVIGVEWEQSFFWGHDCGGIGKYGYCRYYDNAMSTANLNIIDILYERQEKQLELF